MEANDTIYIDTSEIEILSCCEDPSAYFAQAPKVADPLSRSAKRAFQKVEQMLYAAPSFLSLIKAHIPEPVLQVVLTGEQKAKLATGALKLMAKKNGDLLATLVDPNTNQTVAALPLKMMKPTPALAQAMASFSTQMQLAQIATQIQEVQLAIEEVRQGQEYDRLATAYSCQQKFLQYAVLQDPECKRIALMQLVADAEDSRNLLMLSQKVKVEAILQQPASYRGKLFHGTSQDKVIEKLGEIREGLSAINITSLVQAMAYQELGEDAAAKKSLEYYGDFLQTTYFSAPGLVERLDLIDPSPTNYWSTLLPSIETNIQALSLIEKNTLIGAENHEQ